VYFSAKTLFNAQLFGRGNGIFVAPLFKVQIATSGFNRPAVAPNGTSAATLHGGLLGPADYLVLDSSPLPLGVIPANVTNIGDCDVNSNGDLVFTVLINSQVNALYLYKSKMFSFTNIATGRAIPAINDRGTVAALFTEGTEYLAVGLGKPSDTILSVGDAFMGSTVTELDFQSGGLSESNQLAFYAALADGRSGIYVTTVPEPAALGMVAGMAMLLRRRRLAQC
jgi:hypothetical protein